MKTISSDELDTAKKTNKNVVFLLCDSLLFDKDLINRMPAISKYKNNMLIFNNYFAQAPFTEAATVPMFTASNVLDYKSSLNNLKYKPININEVFKELGFKTYNTFHFYANSLSYLRGVDEYDYISSWGVASPFVTYRLGYYKELYNQGKLSDVNRAQLLELVEDLFEMITLYLLDFKENKYKFNLLLTYTDFSDEYMKQLEIEYEENQTLFMDDKELYMNNLLNGENTFFVEKRFTIKTSDEYKNNEEQLNKHIKNITIKQLANSLLKGYKNNVYRVFNYTFKNYNSETVEINNVRKRLGNTAGYGFKYEHGVFSASVLLNNVSNYLKENNESDNFVFCHLEDNHAPFNFLSFELPEVEGEIEELLSNKKIHDNENYYYTQTVRYVNNQIEDFIERLKLSGDWDNTTLIVTSDHGSSHTGLIERNNKVTNFFDENYKIPLYIINKEIKGREIDNFGISSQFLPTVLDALNLKDDDKWINSNSLIMNDSEAIIFEYHGSGTPDYTKRDRKFCIRSKKYKIEYITDSNNESGNVISIYDLEKDPRELNNVLSKYLAKPEIVRLIEMVKVRASNII